MASLRAALEGPIRMAEESWAPAGPEGRVTATGGEQAATAAPRAPVATAAPGPQAAAAALGPQVATAALGGMAEEGSSPATRCPVSQTRESLRPGRYRWSSRPAE